MHIWDPLGSLAKPNDSETNRIISSFSAAVASLRKRFGVDQQNVPLEATADRFSLLLESQRPLCMIPLINVSYLAFSTLDQLICNKDLLNVLELNTIKNLQSCSESLMGYLEQEQRHLCTIKRMSSQIDNTTLSAYIDILRQDVNMTQQIHYYFVSMLVQSQGFLKALKGSISSVHQDSSDESSEEEVPELVRKSSSTKRRDKQRRKETRKKQQAPEKQFTIPASSNGERAAKAFAAHKISSTSKLRRKKGKDSDSDGHYDE